MNTLNKITFVRWQQIIAIMSFVNVNWSFEQCFQKYQYDKKFLTFADNWASRIANQSILDCTFIKTCDKNRDIDEQNMLIVLINETTFDIVTRHCKYASDTHTFFLNNITKSNSWILRLHVVQKMFNLEIIFDKVSKA